MAIGCIKPMIRAETHETYRNQSGGISYKAKFYGIELPKLSMEMKHLNNMVISGRYKRYDIIPCGKCIGCRLEYARDKAVQLSLENQNPLYEENEKWFVTLTYNDEHLPTHTVKDERSGKLIEGISVSMEDMQKFWKRVRKKYPEKKIRYLCCIEYGKKTFRPHAHAIIFGLPLHEELFIKLGNNSQGDPIWTSPELQELWSTEDKNSGEKIPIGNVQIGKVTFQSISYVARYTVKKINKEFNNDWWYAAQGMAKETISQSDDLGQWYYDEHKKEIYNIDIVPVMDNKGNFCRPPRSFDRRFKEEYPDKWKEVVKKRKEAMKSAIWDQEQQTDMTFQEIMSSKELIMSQFKDLRGEGI